jgi:hypothetical protein
MQDYENIYDTINDILGNSKGNFSILEEQIDVDLQMEYFEYSKNYKQTKSPEEIMESKDDIFHQEVTEEGKKNLLIELASIENVEAYRTIEKYLEKPENDFLKDWATLAFQESRMLLESHILDQNQIFISTGLGGKDGKLRYFVVLLSKSDNYFGFLQKKILKNEIQYFLTRNSSELEEIHFAYNFVTFRTIIPIEVPITALFKQIIDECNQFGSFLQDEYIITNVKELSFTEISEYLEHQQNSSNR